MDLSENLSTCLSRAVMTSPNLVNGGGAPTVHSWICHCYMYIFGMVFFCEFASSPPN